MFAILAILSNEGSLVGTQIAKVPLDSSLPLLLAQLDVAGVEIYLLDCMVAQPGVAEGLGILLSEGKIVPDSIDETVPVLRVL